MKDKLDALRRLIRETLPDHKSSIGVTMYDGCEGLKITFYGCKSYEEGTMLFQSLGIGERNKSILDGNTKEAWVSITGKIGEHEFSAYCSGLPPSCKLETYIEKIPKSQTVETEEFIEVERTKVVCGGVESI